MTTFFFRCQCFARALPRTSSLVFSSCLLLLCASQPVTAQTNDWNGGAGNWSDGTKWSQGSTPGVDDDVRIDGGKNGTNSNVTMDTDATIQSLVIDSGDSLSANDHTKLKILGTSFTNNGTLELNSTGSWTSIRIANGGTLTGTGSIIMSDNFNNQILTNPGAGVLTQGANHTIRGTGQLLVNSGDMVNYGTIIADQAGCKLIIDPETSFENHGLLLADGGILDIREGDATYNGGIVNAVDGTIGGDGTLDVSTFSFHNDGTISPGMSPGTLNILGDYTESATAKLFIEIAGTNQGIDFDFLDITGNATLAGILQIDLLGFTPSATDVFEILSANNLSGMFSNANGTVMTLEGHTFDVTYTGNVVRLSNFQAAGVPEPTSLLLLLGLASLGMIQRRRRT